jgi:RNA polymerase sigma-70 factor (ECF subfamily)
VLVSVSHESEQAALVRSAQAGDRAAFGKLYQQYARMIHGILLASVSYTDAEDLMQDVFVRAMEQVGALRDVAAFGAWLGVIARRAALDHHRRVQPMSSLVDAIPGGDRPDGVAFEVLDTIRQLPEAYREALILRLVEGMTGKEIALRTGLTEASVRVNLCRGMKMLREKSGMVSGER